MMVADIISHRSSICQFNQNQKYERKRTKLAKRNKMATPIAHLPATIQLWFILVFFPDYTYNSYKHPSLRLDQHITSCGLRIPSTLRMIFYLLILTNIIMLSGDIHPNPGPITVQTTVQTTSLCTF